MVFKAAFPSVSHGYLHHVLSALGVPDSVCHFICNLYFSYRCQVIFADVAIEGFPIGAGIRQGCPISTLLFALVVDIVLRHIQRSFPSPIISAFAYDSALVVEDVAEALPVLHNIFGDLELVAGLTLNRRKCVVILLWPPSVEQVRRGITTRFGDWAQISVGHSRIYFGVVVRPCSVDKFWDKAVNKYLDGAKI